MNQPNRHIAPPFTTISHIDILASESYLLSNQIPVHIINGGSQEVVKIEFIFNAGIWNQNAPLVAGMANTMLNEGSKKYSAGEIAEKMDFYGAYLGFSTEKHDASISLYSLEKHFEATLNVVEDIIKNSTFPEKEFHTILQNKKQKFLIDQEKTSTLAKAKFTELIYGKNHPYANVYDTEAFDQLKIDDLKEFYRQHYTAGNCTIVVAGKVHEETLLLIDKKFGAAGWPSAKHTIHKKYKLEPGNTQKTFILKEDAVQASIRIGRPMVNKLHPDYTPMHLLNLILGGYFGSRLMQNIREDKAYTYGVNSFLISQLTGGHFAIVTEVGAKVCKEAVKEIYNEIKELRENPVSADELLLVKNYIIGEMLRNLDNPFALSDSLKGNLPYGFDNSYYKLVVSELKKVTTTDIKQLANKYLQEEDLQLVVCGPQICTHAVS